MNFLNIPVYQENRFETKQILEIKTYFQALNAFQYQERTSAHDSLIFKRTFL